MSDDEEVKYDRHGYRIGRRTGTGCEQGQWRWANRERRRLALERHQAAPPKGNGRPHVRDARAIERCIATLKRTHGRGTARDVYYTPSVGEADRQNMGPFIRRWWPICVHAYQTNTFDLL
jgi:hypothetical protein